MSSTTISRPVSDRLGALVFVAIGVAILVGVVAPDASRYVLASIAGLCLVGFVLTRDYGFAVAAGVMGGIGTAVALIAGSADPSAAGPVFMLSVAGGFTATWLLGLASRPAESHPWPLVPAGITALIGTSLALDRPALLDGAVVVASIVIIVVGVRLFVRRTED